MGAMIDGNNGERPEVRVGRSVSVGVLGLRHTLLATCKNVTSASAPLADRKANTQFLKFLHPNKPEGIRGYRCVFLNVCLYSADCQPAREWTRILTRTTFWGSIPPLGCSRVTLLYD